MTARVRLFLRRLRARLQRRVLHGWFLVSRPMTLGVRAVVYDRDRNAVMLIRHTYVSGWHLPGGGVEPGETMAASLLRELSEEANIEALQPPALRSIHFNRSSSRRDHVALYLVEAFRSTGPKRADREIAAAEFFPLDALPRGTTPATRRRLAEVLGSEPPLAEW